MTQYIQFTAVVPAATVQMYRDAAAQVHPSAVGMFTTPLYTGAEITHYISTGLIDCQFCEIVTDPAAFAAATGFTVEQGQAFKDGFSHLATGSDADEDNPAPLHNREAITHLGLTLNPSGHE